MKFSNYLVLCSSHCDNHKQITKTCYFNACLEYIFSFKIFMNGRGIKILGSSSVLMMLFSLWQSEVISFNYTFYTQLLLFFSFFWQSWKLRPSPFTSTSPEESEVPASSLLSTFSFLLFSQMPSISRFKGKNKPTKHSLTLVLNTCLDRVKAQNPQEKFSFLPHNST